MIFLAKIKIRVLGIHLTSAPLPSNSPLPSLTWLSPTTFGVKFLCIEKNYQKIINEIKAYCTKFNSVLCSTHNCVLYFIIITQKVLHTLD